MEDSNSLIKHFSNKPLLITLKDSLIATTITLSVMLIVMFLYYTYTETPENERQWTGIIVRSIATTITTQFVYEYLGVNSMLAESSMRYARGSTLAKYVSRKSAMIHQIYYEILTDVADNKIVIEREDLDNKFSILKFLVENPKIRGKISTAAKSHEKLTELKGRMTDPNIIAIIDAFPADTLAMLDTFVDRLSDTNVREFLLHGIISI